MRFQSMILLLTIIWSSMPGIVSGQEGRINLGDGPDKVFAREQWFSAQRLENGTPPAAQQRIEAWEHAQSMNVHQPNVMLKSGAMASRQWVCVGPKNRGGRITGIACHPWDPDVIYMTAANGGIWKTVDGCRTVVPIADHLPTLAMGAIAVDPSDPNLVWAGSGEGNVWSYSYPGVGIFKSTDAGASWKLTGMQGNTRVAAIRVHPMRGSTVLAAMFTGLYRTTDKGDSWEKVLEGEVYDLAVTPYGDTWYAGVRGRGIYKSTDTGDTWEWLSEDWAETLSITTSEIRRVALDVSRSQPATVYAVLVKNSGSSLYAVLQSNDAGETWERLLHPASNMFGGQGFYNCDLAVDPLNPERVLIGGVLIHVTTDKGKNWSISSPSFYDIHALEFAPAEPTMLLAGHDGGYSISLNAGANFDTEIRDMPITQYYDIAVSHRNPDVILGGAQDNGSHLGSALNMDWSKVTNEDGGVCLIDYDNPRYMYTEKQYGGMHWRSDDSGNTWLTITDGLEGTGAWVTPVIMHPTDPRVLYTATTSQLYMTVNRGEQWYPLAEGIVPNRYIEKLAISAANPDHIAAGYNSDGGLAFSTDGGSTWTRRGFGVLPSFVSDIEYHRSNPDEIYVCFAGWGEKHVFKTTDGGVNWNDITGNLPEGPVNTIALDPAHDGTCWAGTDLGVYVTTNGGERWQILGEGMPFVSVQDLEYHALSGRLFAATHGRGVWELVAATPVDVASYSVTYDNGTAVLKWNEAQHTAMQGFAIERMNPGAGRWTEIGYVPSVGCASAVCPYTYRDATLPTGARSLVYRIRLIQQDGSYSYSHEMYLALTGSAASMALYQNYPNPFNPATTIRYTLPHAADVQIEVTNAQGIRVAVLVDRKKAAGVHVVPFDASSFPGGVYFCHLISGGERRTRKMVVLK